MAAVAYPAQQIDVTDTTVRYNASTGTATLDDVLDAGALYQVASARVQPTPEQLGAVVFPRSIDLPGTSLEGIPDDVAAGLRAIAEQWTEGAANDYEAVLADPGPSQRRLGLHVRHGRPGARRLVPHSSQFLTETKRGFCQQFAVAMAMMLRTLGFPTRLAERGTRRESATPTRGRGTSPRRNSTCGSRCSSRRMGGSRSSRRRTARTPSRTSTRTPRSAARPERRDVPAAATGA